MKITGTENWGAGKLFDRLGDTYMAHSDTESLLGALIVLTKIVVKQGKQIEQFERRVFRAEQRQVHDAGVAQ